MDFNPESAEFQRLLRQTESQNLPTTFESSSVNATSSTSTLVAGVDSSSSNFASTSTSGSAEFTKRKNWSQQIVEELKDFLHVISPTGKLMYCSPSSVEMVGYTPEELVNRTITDFIHVDDIDMFVRAFDNAMNQKTNFTIYYRFRKKDDKYIILEVDGSPYFGEDNSMGNCKCFFNMARVYPSKTAAMLDSFLELKVENENLRRQLLDLVGPPETTAEGGVSSDTVATTSTTVFSGEENTVEETLQSSTNPINLLVGLRYDEGEYAKGISTGSNDPSLLNKDSLNLNSDDLQNTQIAASTDSVSASPKKKKKLKKEEEEYVCTDCGTVESPEWRKGPLGPKTLCNACGLRWSKKTKKLTSGNAV